MKHFAIAVIAGATVSGALTGAASAQTTTTQPPTSTTTPINYVGSASIGTGLQCILEGISGLTPGGPGFQCFI
ncbi:hypothetical protein [Nocardia stercoris]|nr:hypothetical protein [Nocardia stercoris]